MPFIFHFIYGMSSFPLTFSIIFQDGHIAPPTRYPLVNVYIAMENHHAFNGKIHYFYGHFPLLCKRSPEGSFVKPGLCGLGYGCLRPGGFGGPCRAGGVVSRGISEQQRGAYAWPEQIPAVVGQCRGTPYPTWLWLTLRHGFSMALIEIDGLPIKMVIFHGYVKLPDGRYCSGEYYLGMRKQGSESSPPCFLKHVWSKDHRHGSDSSSPDLCFGKWCWDFHQPFQLVC